MFKLPPPAPKCDPNVRAKCHLHDRQQHWNFWVDEARDYFNATVAEYNAADPALKPELKIKVSQAKSAYNKARFKRAVNWVGEELMEPS